MIKLPSKDDYLHFMELFPQLLSKESPNTCFYIYGAYENGSCNYGRSDIDGGLILDSGLITPKDEILRISKSLLDALNGSRIPIEFNLLDRETCKDGRFLSYTTDYTKWIKESGRIISGPDFLSEMNGLDFKSGVLSTAAMNFSGPYGVRNALLHSLIDASEEDKSFMSKISKALEKAAKFPKKLIYLREGLIVPSRKEAKDRLENILGDIDLTELDKVNALLDNPLKLYSELSNRDKAINLLASSLNCLENMISSYIKHFPNFSPRELKE